MKRPSGDDGDGDPSSKAEELAQKFVNKFPKILMFCGVGLVILLVIAIIILKFSATAH